MNNKFMRAAAFAAAACLSMSSCAEKTKTASKLSAADTISANSDNMNVAELLEGSYKLTEYKTITEFQGIRNTISALRTKMNYSLLSFGVLPKQ